jgi:hypothetical protein
MRYAEQPRTHLGKYVHFTGVKTSSMFGSCGKLAQKCECEGVGKYLILVLAEISARRYKRQIWSKIPNLNNFRSFIKDSCDSAKIQNLME